MKSKLLLLFSAFFHFSFAQVSPFLSTTWNQGCNYNAQCPATGSGGACGRVWTGCNATAIAQICKYYAYPSNGMGDHCNTNNVTHCVDFGAQTYNYAAMPNNVSSANPEVAKLMYHLGIAVDMQWSGSSSNSFFAPGPMKKYYKYSPKMYSTAIFMFDTTEDLIAGIKNEMDNGRPVYAKGGSHFYLIDGYNLSDQFHMNFGWGGVYDGYYAINNVVNGAGTFNPTNFIFNIRPMDGTQEAASDTIYVSAAANNNQVMEFTSLSDWTITSTANWLLPNISSGTAGYYAFLEGSTFNTSLNNGDERIGYLILENADEIDTIVVVQAPSPLQVTPDLLEFEAEGGLASVSLEYFSWGSWAATCSESWISLSALSGTGPAVLNLTCQENVSTVDRSAFVIFTAGAYRDTLFVEQDGVETSGISAIDQDRVSIHPNPTNDFVTIKSTTENNAFQIELRSTNGQRLAAEMEVQDQGSWKLDLRTLPGGLYYLSVYSDISTQTYKIIKL